MNEAQKAAVRKNAIVRSIYLTVFFLDFHRDFL